MKQKNLMVMVVIVLVIGAGAFAGGVKYGQAQIGQSRRQIMIGRNGNGMQPGNFGQLGGVRDGNIGPRQVSGEILSVDENSMTIKLADGSSKIIILPSSGTIIKSSPAEKTDLKTGEKVAVFGTSNSDGSVTAQNIQLNPVFRGPMDISGTRQPIEDQN